MGTNVKSFIRKRNINIDDIMYLIHENRKTVIYFANGEKLETFHPMKQLISEFPEQSLKVINKGVAVALRYVVDIKNKVYIMQDGRELAGRVRSSKDHRMEKKTDKTADGIESWDQFAILDNMPIAFCIIELVIGENGRGVDFIFRYCNKKMEDLEGKTIGEMVGRSFFDVFENGDKKWLVAYADVAVNGVSRIIEGYSPEVDADLKIYCFQPKPNFCACALIKQENTNAD